MSTHYISAAYRAKVGGAITKMVLVKLADNCNDDGFCWPSLNTIARETELSRSTVIRHITRLKALGLVQSQQRTDNSGALTSNSYLLSLAALRRLEVTPAEDAPLVSHRHHPSVTPPPPLVSHRHHPSVSVTPKPSLNHQLEPSIEPTPFTPPPPPPDMKPNGGRKTKSPKPPKPKPPHVSNNPTTLPSEDVTPQPGTNEQPPNGAAKLSGWQAFIRDAVELWDTLRHSAWASNGGAITTRLTKELAAFARHYGKDYALALERLRLGITWAKTRESWAQERRGLSFVELLVNDKVIDYAAKAQHSGLAAKSGGVTGLIPIGTLVFHPNVEGPTPVTEHYSNGDMRIEPGWAVGPHEVTIWQPKS